MKYLIEMLGCWIPFDYCPDCKKRHDYGMQWSFGTRIYDWRCKRTEKRRILIEYTERHRVPLNIDKEDEK